MPAPVPKLPFAALLSAMGHELRNPLAGILSSAEMLRDYSDRLDADERKEIARQIAGSVARATRLLDTVQIMGRAFDGRLTASHDDYNVRELIVDWVGQVRKEFPAHTVDLKIEGDGTERHVDPFLLRFMVLEGIRNALGFSPATAPVTVTLRFRPDHVSIVTEDRGPGVPEADLAQIFDPLYRGANGVRKPGLGLGLASARAAASSHGGSIEFANRPGGGAVFTITLPAPALPVKK